MIVFEGRLFIFIIAILKYYTWLTLTFPLISFRISAETSFGATSFSRPLMLSSTCDLSRNINIKSNLSERSNLTYIWVWNLITCYCECICIYVFYRTFNSSFDSRLWKATISYDLENRFFDNLSMDHSFRI